MAGLLAGCMFQNATIYERGEEGSTQHKALLRFRTRNVGDATGIDFRKVRVHKGIVSNDKFVQPSIRLSNLYSQKVIGRLADRSVWNLDAVDRYIAPEDFLDQLAHRCRGRIVWGHHVSKTDILTNRDPVISTLPMSAMVGHTRGPVYAAPMADEPVMSLFQYERIAVRRWKIPHSDVFQTIYFPDPETNLYRASITGDLLIAEYVQEADNYDFFDSFGLSKSELFEQEGVNQSFGKIAPVEEKWRKQFIFDLTSRHNIYSLGRFGTWRNLLLDDVLTDIGVLKKMIGASAYERSILANL